MLNMHHIPLHKTKRKNELGLQRGEVKQVDKETESYCQVSMHDRYTNGRIDMMISTVIGKLNIKHS